MKPVAARRILAIALLLVGGVASAGPARGAPSQLSVFAAASLTEVFGELGRLLERDDPGINVIFNFAGSQQLGYQIEQGAVADVFASADRRWMAHVQGQGLLAGAPRIFAGNRLVVIIPLSNPGRIARLQDLARPGIKLVLAADGVPAGRYSHEVLAKLAAAPGFAPDYAERVARNVVSQEENVKAVVAKVQLGEADAGVVYRSDVTSGLASSIGIIEIADPYNVVATYPIGLLKGAPHLETGRRFIDLVLSPRGQRVLRDHNFIPVGAL